MKGKGILKQSKGITLIALVLTIIILLILAGITIGTITGDNGIINKVQSAKEETEIANEKEVVEKATVQTMGNNKFGNVEKDGLQDELDKETGEGKTEVTEADEYFKVTFKDSERSYLVDKDGNVIEVVKREGIQVGDYVNYTPDENIEGYSKEKLGEIYTGSSQNTSDLTQNTSLGWRVLRVYEDGSMDLVSDMFDKIYMKGYMAYNNGVYLLNDICESLYSRKSSNIIARSIQVEDFWKMTTQEEREKLENERKEIEFSNQQAYPDLLRFEKDAYINGMKTEGIVSSSESYNRIQWLNYYWRKF